MSGLNTNETQFGPFEWSSVTGTVFGEVFERLVDLHTKIQYSETQYNGFSSVTIYNPNCHAIITCNNDCVHISFVKYVSTILNNVVKLKFYYSDPNIIDNIVTAITEQFEINK